MGFGHLGADRSQPQGGRDGWPGAGVPGTGSPGTGWPLRGTRAEVPLPGALLGGTDTGAQWVVPLGGIVEGGMVDGGVVSGVMGWPGLFGVFGVVGAPVGLLGVLGVLPGAAVATIAAAPRSAPERAT